MIQPDKRVERCHEVPERGSEHVVLECDCRARLVLVGDACVHHPLECGMCGEKFVRTAGCHRSARREVRRLKGRYPWLEGCIERLEGKEARHEYYARLERVDPISQRCA